MSNQKNKTGERCDLCKFWKNLGLGQDHHPDDRPGQCRRYPPVLDLSEADSWMDKTSYPNSYGHSYFDFRFWNYPVNNAAEWCGEFNRK